MMKCKSICPSPVTLLLLKTGIWCDERHMYADCNSLHESVMNAFLVALVTCMNLSTTLAPVWKLGWVTSAVDKSSLTSIFSGIGQNRRWWSSDSCFGPRRGCSCWLNFKVVFCQGLVLVFCILYVYSQEQNQSHLLVILILVLVKDRIKLILW